MRVGKGLGALTLALALAASTPLSAQTPPAPAQPESTDPDAVLVQELVVTARDKGPAWWTVSNGQSTVYVLGAPSLAPKRMTWDRTVFDRRLKSANQVILPFQNLKVHVLGLFGLGVRLMRLRSMTPFEETLDPATRARFVAARTKVGMPANRYNTKNPLAAGLLLATDYRKHEDLTGSDPGKPIRVYAKLAGAPVQDKVYDVGPLLGAVLRTPPAAGRACLNEVIDQVLAGPAVTLNAAKAWADGNVRGALENERTYERCVAVVPGAAQFDAQVKADEARAIEEALKKPGHAIAVIQLRPLLAQGGVLDRLRAAGYQIKTPDED